MCHTLTAAGVFINIIKLKLSCEPVAQEQKFRLVLFQSILALVAACHEIVV